MKKIYGLVLTLIITFMLTGCGKTATDAVKKYLDNYKNLDVNVLTDMKDIIEKENLNEENSKKYEDIYKKQYTDLSYEIEKEDYNGDEATITVKIDVYDLYKAQKDSTTYLANNPDEFKDSDGKYVIQC